MSRNFIRVKFRTTAWSIDLGDKIRGDKQRDRIRQTIKGCKKFRGFERNTMALPLLGNEARHLARRTSQAPTAGPTIRWGQSPSHKEGPLPWRPRTVIQGVARHCRWFYSAAASPRNSVYRVPKFARHDRPMIPRISYENIIRKQERDNRVTCSSRSA